MTEIQKNILAAVQMSISTATVPISEEKISEMVEFQEKFMVMTGATPLTDDERNEIIKSIHASLAIIIDRGHSLKAKGHQPWYNAAKAGQPSKFWDRYKRYLLKEGWSNDTVNGLDRTTDEIMDYLGNPDSSEPFLRRGLCIGDIQSGKTSTYIGLINKAADAHYRVIILLTGTIEKLRRQTQQRIDEGFIGLDSYAFTLEKDNNQVQVGVGSIDADTHGWAVTSTTSDFNTATAQRIVGHLSSISDPIIFVLKKNKSVLEKLEQWLRFYNVNKMTQKIDLPMILIDDEADNASINTKEGDVSAINERIRKLLILFEKSNYIGFTATPYANIFIDPDSDQDMLARDLFPADFIYALTSPSNYIGARSVFSEDAKYSYMLESNDDCEQALPIKHKNGSTLAYIPQSLKKAIAAFFIANAVRDLRGETNSHRTMMVNMSRFVSTQNQITEVIDAFVRSAKTEIRNYYLMGTTALQYDIFKLLKDAYDNYFSQFASDPEFADLKHFSWEEIQDVLYPAIERIEVRTVNGGNASKNLDYEKYELEPNDFGLRLIAVGGMSLSRGLTLEGLCTSYFYRNSTMYDTLMQMGRWFGYREKYRDLCKIWMPDESMAWYKYISMASDELIDEVKRMEEADMTPENFGLAVRSDLHGLYVTAKNKMRTAEDYEVEKNVSGEVVETRYLPASLDILRKNFDVTENFLKFISENYSVHHDDPVLALKNFQYLNVDGEKISEFLDSFYSHPLNVDFSISDLTRMFKEDDQGIFENWDVLIASGYNTAEEIQLPGLKIHLVKRSFSYRKDTKSIQLSGKNSRLGSKDLAKGGLTLQQVKELDNAIEQGKTVGERFYFKSGIPRNPLMVIYPVKLSYTIKNEEHVDEEKEKIISSINFPIIGLSIGIPFISGKEPKMLKFKINKQKQHEIYDIDEENFDEQDPTIPEE